MQELLLTKTTQRSKLQDLEFHIAMFQQGLERWWGYLRPLGITIVPQDPDATCTYLHDCISWKRYQLRCPWPAVHLDQQLSDTVLVPGEPPQLGAQWIQPVTIGSWQPDLSTWLPETLAKMPFPCRYHVRWAPMGLKAADSTLEWREKEWSVAYARAKKVVARSLGAGSEPSPVQGRDSRIDAIQAGQSVLDVRAEIVMGQEVLGTLTPTLFCWAPDLDMLHDRIEMLEIAMHHHGLVARVEEAGSTLAYVASIPGNTDFGTEGLPLRTQELTGIMPHSHIWGGPHWNPRLHGPPLFVATTDGTPFRFVTHVDETGHMLIVGPQRSGKSALLGLMCRQWFRYTGARMCLFDRDNALKIATILGGGLHYDLGSTSSAGRLGFQPFRNVHLEQERAWLATWVETLLRGEGLPPTPDERGELWESLGALARLDPALRTFSMFRRVMQIPRLKVGLEPFCRDGPLDLLDANADAFSLEARLVCFEMKALQDTKPRAVGPIFSLLFHRLETDWFTGDPVAIVVDEVKWVWAVPEFQNEGDVMLKTRAKKNVALWLSGQEIFDLARTDSWQAMQGSIPTKICLPNAQALAPSVRPFYEELGMDESEIQGISTGQIRRDYFYHSLHGNRRFQLELSPVERLLCAASTLEELHVFDELRSTVPPDDLAAAWLRHWGYDDAAATLTQLGGSCEDKFLFPA